MLYNFDEVISRKNTNSYKWDSEPRDTIIPMWVADMDFRTAQPIIDALENRVRHGLFGYTKVPEEYFDTIIQWFGRRHHYVLSKEQVLYTTGVVPALSAIIKALSQPGDQVIVQTPVYNCFYSSIKNNGCKVLPNELVYRDGRYYIDFEDLEKKAKQPKTSLMLLCSPHNPVGRVWSREELMKIGEICKKNNIVVVSDEIHCEIVFPGCEHIPFASINKEFSFLSVTCNSSSEAFNLAGLQVANILALDAVKRKRINEVLNINEICEISPLAVTGLLAAYKEGEAWLDELNNYLYENYKFLTHFFNDQLPQFRVVPLEATYLVWVDCSALNSSSENIAKYLLNKHDLHVNDGMMYGHGGENFIRINIACPRTILEKGLLIIKNAFINFINESKK